MWGETEGWAELVQSGVWCRHSVTWREDAYLMMMIRLEEVSHTHQKQYQMGSETD